MIPQLELISETVRLPVQTRHRGQANFVRGKIAVWDAKHTRPETTDHKERRNEVKAAPPRPWHDLSMDTIKLSATVYFSCDLEPADRQELVDKFHTLIENALQFGGVLAPEVAEAIDFDIAVDE